ncbi:MAG: hypothetical protein FWG02_09900 [Holophagaceae bacterium]|nr:hypothetical protein [Holophagaceae bacterium]
MDNGSHEENMTSLTSQPDNKPNSKKQPFPKYKKILLMIFIPWAVLFCAYRLLNNPVVFYGKVVDQNDNPIPGVRITAKLTGTSPLCIIGEPIFFFTQHPIFSLLHFNRTIRRKTDKDGIFIIKDYYGIDLRFERLGLFNSDLSWEHNKSFVKKGYAFVFDEVPISSYDSSFLHRHKSIRERVHTRFYVGKQFKGSLTCRYGSYEYFKLTNDTPIIYKMREIEERTYLLNQERSFSESIFFAGKKDRTSYYDLTWGSRVPLQDNNYSIIGSNGRRHTNDLEISSVWEESQNRWAITFALGAGKGGIQISNKKLYTAPESGYKPEVTFYVNRGKKREEVDFIFLDESPDEPLQLKKTGRFHGDPRCYFYLKSRDCNIFSRVEMRIRTFRYDYENDPELEFYLQFDVNPFAGQRSLDPEPNLHYELRRALEKEIHEAFNKDPNAIIPPPPSKMYNINKSQIPQIMAEWKRGFSK